MYESRRKIHLDFHTHPSLTGVCAGFDAELFADTLARAKVDAVVLFAKDHYGYAFYKDCQTGPVHPGLEADFLREAAAACRARGIGVEAYISVCLDHVTVEAHPDWACRNANGSVAAWGPVNVLLDLASPMMEEVVLPLSREVAALDVDGLWYDIVMYPDDGFYSAHMDAALAASGLGADADAAARGACARDVAIAAQMAIREAVHAVNPGLTVRINNQALLGDRRAFAANDGIEIESDPTHWPAYDLPLRARYVEATGQAFHGLTTRFHRCWGDFGGLRAPAQLRAELGAILAAGATHVSLGDHLHPSGVLERTVYEHIGTAYTAVEGLLPYLDGTTAWPEVAILQATNHAPYTAGRTAQLPSLGAARALTETHRQYTALDATEAGDAGGALLLLPGGAPLAAADIAAVRAAVAAGASLLACGNHVCGLEDLVGSGPAVETALDAQYLLFGGALMDPAIGGMPIATYRRAWTLQPGAGSFPVAQVQAPLFDGSLAKNYHAYGPVDPAATPQPAIVARGPVILCGVPLPELLHSEDAWPFQAAFSRLLMMLRPINRSSCDGGPTVEVSLRRRDPDLLVHVVAWEFTRPGESRARMRSFTPRTVAVHVRETVRPARCYDAATGRDLDWQMGDGYLAVHVPLATPHVVVVCERALE